MGIKLLHIGLTAGEKKWLCREFAERTDYVEIKPKVPIEHIKRLYLRHRPDLVFMQIQENIPELLPLVRSMSNKSVVINWCGDVRDPLPRWYYDFDPYCITAFSNMRDVRAIKGQFLQIGFEHKIFKRYENTQGVDIVFMGNRSDCFPLSEYRNQVVDFLKKKYGKRFKVLGSWPGADGNLMYNQYEEAKFYSGSKIAISVSHFNISRYFSDRLIRAMGSGCFTLSHHYDDIEKDFKVGEHLETFRSLSQLREKIDFYLERNARRQLIADAGYKYVHSKFTVKHMVDRILNIYEKNKSFH